MAKLRCWQPAPETIQPRVPVTGTEDITYYFSTKYKRLSFLRHVTATLKRTGPQGCTGPYRALRCSVIGRLAGFIWSAVINIDYRIPDDDTEA